MIEPPSERDGLYRGEDRGRKLRTTPQSRTDISSGPQRRLEAARETQAGAKTEASTPAQELPPERSAEEWEKEREKARAILDEFKKSLRSGPREDASTGR